MSFRSAVAVVGRQAGADDLDRAADAGERVLQPRAPRWPPSLRAAPGSSARAASPRRACARDVGVDRTCTGTASPDRRGTARWSYPPSRWCRPWRGSASRPADLPFETICHSARKNSLEWKRELIRRWSLPISSSREYLEISQNLSLTYLIRPPTSVIAMMADWSSAYLRSARSFIDACSRHSASRRSVMSVPELRVPMTSPPRRAAAYCATR